MRSFSGYRVIRKAHLLKLGPYHHNGNDPCTCIYLQAAKASFTVFRVAGDIMVPFSRLAFSQATRSKSSLRRVR